MPPPHLRLTPMRPRDPSEPARTASSLELFFDLVFVVAVSIAAVELHHQLTEGHVVHGVVAFAMVFFAIWWAWMNFTWFATSFDTEDWLYRLLTFVQMAGVLVLASGIEDAYSGHYTLVVLGYVLMRIAMVAQWVRAAHGAADRRSTALTYAAGITTVQVLWLVWLTLPSKAALPGFIVLAGTELAVPIVAERRAATPWHPHHITERYGLFTLILLGESLLASTNAIIKARHEQAALGPLIAIALLAFIATAALWWIYFWPHHHRSISTLRSSLTYGYAHYFIFAAAGAFSAGIEAEIDVLAQHSELTDTAASYTVTIPIAIFVLGTWQIAIRSQADKLVNTVVPVAGLLVLLDPVIPIPIALTAAVLIAVVVVLVARPPLRIAQPATAGDTAKP